MAGLFNRNFLKNRLVVDFFRSLTTLRNNSLKNVIDSNKEWANSSELRKKNFFPKLAATQKPKIFWVGCADSRVPPEMISQLGFGQLFVHRNIANQFRRNDNSCESALEYAVHYLKVEHVIICGHTRCGGIEHAFNASLLPHLKDWVKPIQDVYRMHEDKFKSVSRKQEFDRILVELNVREQVRKVIETDTVKAAWAVNQPLAIHGWVYHLESGILEDLKITIDETTTVFIIDVGPTMWQKVEDTGASALDLALKAVLIMLESKIFSGRKTDMTSVVAVGTDDLETRILAYPRLLCILLMYSQFLILSDTDNDFAGDDIKYEHITVISGIEQPMLSLLQTVSNELPRGSVPGDCYSAIEVAKDLITKHCKHLKYIKKIYLFTDGESEIDTRESDALVHEIRRDGIEMKIVGVGFDDPDTGFKEQNKSKTKAANETFLRRFAEDCGGDVFTMNYFLNQLELPQVKAIRYVNLYKGKTLVMGDAENYPDSSLSIPIEVYSRTAIARPKTAGKWSVLSEAASIDPEIKTHGVHVSRTYTISSKKEKKQADEDNRIEVPVEDLEKAYTFGRTIVPLISYDQELLHLATTASMDILGFIKAEDFRREYVLSTVLVILPQKNDLDASLRISALIQGLYIKNAYGLVRYVSKANADPRVGIIVPYIKPPRECLYFAKLPFKEEYRTCIFPSLSNIKDKTGKIIEQHKKLPTKEMLDKMGEYIAGMDLMEAAVDEEGNPKEHLKVKETFNPVLYRIAKATSHRALHPNEPLVPFNERFLYQTKILPSLEEKNRKIVGELSELLQIKKVPPKAKRRRVEISRKGVGEIDVEDILGSKDEDEDLDNVVTKKSASSWSFDEDVDVREIGVVDPVSDFKKMTEYRKEDLVTTAVEQMCGIIKKLIMPPDDGKADNEKAFQCLEALREVAKTQNESQSFNEFLRELYNESLKEQSKIKDFWEMIISSEITLISSDEAPDSNISKYEADQTKFITRLAGGDPFLGCYALAVTIFSLGIFRDYLYKKALENQPQHPGLQNDYVRGAAIVLFLAGNVFVLSSMYALGVTGTYLGDYFGILMNERVTSFPFNVLENPMYYGSTMVFAATALWFACPAGLVLTAWAFFCYIVALRFEGPFTTMIYERRDAASAKAEKEKEN
ncbi:817_t:CDS:10 [Ambispora leptoticha]|uniref:Phosphatidyl-N-methylethanolamine N-methyltransferase n=1 Tax=Ambispora leptoticha TaxID=144679 RepID=A0A9N8V4Z2_9GLOM|nr:817_t:CDS:10 [Ambispora leptoticha]